MVAQLEPEGGPRLKPEGGPLEYEGGPLEPESGPLEYEGGSREPDGVYPWQTGSEIREKHE